jgi:hypothetical protein
MARNFSRHSEDRILIWHSEPDADQLILQRNFILHSAGGSGGTSVVRFRYRVRGGGWKVGTVILDIPNTEEQRAMRPPGARADDWLEEWIRKRIMKFLADNPTMLLSTSGPPDAQPIPEMLDDGSVEIMSTTYVMTAADILRAVSLHSLEVADLIRPARFHRMFADDKHLHQRSFRYLFPGFDVPTLGHMISDGDMEPHLMQCDRMCAYRMLRELNPGNRDGRGIFEPLYVNKWLNENGHPVGTLESGLSPEDIQAHAEAHHYGHCALDLSRSVVSFHLPDDRLRNHHYRTVVYYVVGDHCQPVNDPNVTRAIMRGASSQLGKRSLLQFDGYMEESKAKRACTSSSRTRRRWIQTEAPDTDTAGNRTNTDTEQCLMGFEMSDQDPSIHPNSPDLTAVNIREEVERPDMTDGGTIPGGRRSNQRLYPTNDELDQYLHRFQEEDMDIIEAKCNPEYWEGEDRQRMHLYVCTNSDNVEFLYQYLVRVLKVDPMVYARSYGGLCCRIRLNNICWCACRELDSVIYLNQKLFPKGIFRNVGGLGGYGLVMLQRSMGNKTSLVDAMSVYPVDLQRIMDHRGQWNVNKQIQETFQAPYSDPRRGDVQTLIQPGDRQRIDLIRSYTSMIGLIQRDQDQFPIHDITNVLRPYKSSNATHRSLPIGTYVVRCPTHPRHPQLQKLFPFLSRRPGKMLSMTHRLLRFCIQRQLLGYEDIMWICTTTPERQKYMGRALVEGLWKMVDSVYKMQREDEGCPSTFEPKQIVNLMIGMCQGTKVAHQGQRYVFADLQSLWVLMLGMLSGEQLRHCKILHHKGTFWHQDFDYYEMDSTGMALRKYHMQPVYQMIVESQSMVLFETSCKIPLPHMIQMNIDAIEFIKGPNQEWYKDVMGQVLTDDEYENLKENMQLLTKCNGTFHREVCKDESQAVYYHYRYDHQYNYVSPRETIQGSRIWIHREEWENIGVDAHTGPLLEDWKNQIRVVSGADVHGFVTEWFLEWESGHGSGILITGAAGTGKTHLTRQLEQMAQTRGLVTVKLAHTHAACCQMGPGAQTLSSYFCLDERQGVRTSMMDVNGFVKSKEVDVMFIDEISMIPLSIWEALFLHHRQHPQTRFVLVGDFYQLPPIETLTNANGEATDYWEGSDMIPQLLYDYVTNQHGHWIQMRECRRSEDPLMKLISEHPKDIASRVYEEESLQKLHRPMDSRVPIWRFCAWRNVTRKAVNMYCGVRYAMQHPDRKSEFIHLPRLWSETKKRPIEQWLTKATSPPSHWQHLQSFRWVEGMECICRNTMYFVDRTTQERSSRGAVNNRRGILVELGGGAKGDEIVVQWKDQPDERTVLSRWDFAFHFVPGFCATVHMSQGESIAEHFGVMEWNDIRRNTRMAYVALTRTTHSDLLHLIPERQWEPWTTANPGLDLASWVLQTMYQLYRQNQTLHMDYENVLGFWEKEIQEAVEQNHILSCTLCGKRLDLPCREATFSPSLVLYCKGCPWTVPIVPLSHTLLPSVSSNPLIPLPSPEQAQQEQDTETEALVV